MSNPFSQLQPEQWQGRSLSEAARRNGQRAWGDFLKRGLPGPRDEAWHYTDLGKFLSPAPRPVVQDASLAAPQAGAVQEVSSVVHLINGRFHAASSKVPAGVDILSLEEALNQGFAGLNGAAVVDLIRARAERVEDQHGGLVDLQQALLKNGVVLRVTRDQKPDAVVLRQTWSPSSEPTLGSVTCLIWIEEGASLSLIEENWGVVNVASASWTHVELGANARLELVRLRHNEIDALSLGLLSVAQQAGSEFSGTGLFAGGRLLRETWSFDHLGSAAATRLSALQLGSKQSQLDLHTVVNHQVPAGLSEQRVRLFAADESRTVYNGKIVISKDAQNVNSAQLTQGLILGEKAEVDAKPELEIYADNVKASHGASVGQLDEEELFYLMSRGLTKSKAMRLLSEGFARDAVARVEDAKVRRDLEAWLGVELKNVIQETAT